MVLVYLVLDQARYTPYDAHYLPGAATPLTRLSEPKNYRDGPDPPERTVLCAEVPAWVGDGLWDRDDADLARLVADTLSDLDLPAVHPDRPCGGATPRGVPGAAGGGRSAPGTWSSDTCATSLLGHGIVSFGRQGLHAHDNTHHALAMAWEAVACLDRHGSLRRAALGRAPWSASPRTSSRIELNRAGGRSGRSTGRGASGGRRAGSPGDWARAPGRPRRGARSARRGPPGAGTGRGARRSGRGGGTRRRSAPRRSGSPGTAGRGSGPVRSCSRGRSGRPRRPRPRAPGSRSARRSGAGGPPTPTRRSAPGCPAGDAAASGGSARRSGSRPRSRPRRPGSAPTNRCSSSGAYSPSASQKATADRPAWRGQGQAGADGRTQPLVPARAQHLGAGGSGPRRGVVRRPIVDHDTVHRVARDPAGTRRDHGGDRRRLVVGGQEEQHRRVRSAARRPAVPPGATRGRRAPGGTRTRRRAPGATGGRRRRSGRETPRPPPGRSPTATPVKSHR